VINFTCCFNGISLYVLSTFPGFDFSGNVCEKCKELGIKGNLGTILRPAVQLLVEHEPSIFLSVASVSDGTINSASSMSLSGGVGKLSEESLSGLGYAQLNASVKSSTSFFERDASALRKTDGRS